MIAEAVALAKKSDIAILYIGGNREYESEGRDRKDLSLPFGEQVLVEAVTAVNQKTIVVVVGGAPYDIGAIKKQNNTIVWSWYNGSENGNALADVFIGIVNPSGKLPFTFPASIDQSPAHAMKAYPGENLSVTYKEGILVGYRWFDTKKIEPLYCFGYGLSYTDFSYSRLQTSKTNYKSGETITVTLTITNSGKYDGKETVQLYINKSGSAVERADKELKAFKKIMVNKGAAVEVKLKIPVADLAYYDTSKSKWIIEPGKYTLLAGTSSGIIKLNTTITIE